MRIVASVVAALAAVAVGSRDLGIWAGRKAGKKIEGKMRQRRGQRRRVRDSSGRIGGAEQQGQQRCGRV